MSDCKRRGKMSYVLMMKICSFCVVTKEYQTINSQEIFEKNIKL